MRITICAVGSRGDIQPTVALARGLARAGHEARLFTHEMFADLARAHHVDFVPLPGDPRQGMITTAVVELGNNPIRLARWLRVNFRPVFRELFQRTLEAVAGSDLVISASVSLAAFHIAEKLGIPAISTLLQPFTVTRAFPGALIPPPPSWLPFRGLYNVALTKLGNQAVFQMIRPLTNEWRREILDLPPLSARYYWSIDAPGDDVPMIYAYSPAVLPKPPDWGPYKQVTGYWFLDAPVGFEPSEELRTFLAEGPPPVYLGLGSVIDHEREETTRIAIESMRRAGLRAILQAGWSGLGNRAVPDSVLVVGDVPHDWLFPRLAAVVHHGGAGTAAAALRAGLPAVVVPFFGDQFFWARRMHALGVATRPVPRKGLTVERLVSAVQQAAHDPGMRERAERLGERIAGEDGVGRAVALIEQFAAGRVT